MSEVLLDVKNLKAGYGKNIVVDEVSFSVKRNEIFGIVGESGSGKSTLLKALINPKEYGIQLYGGTAFFHDHELLSLSLSERKKLYGSKISMVFQNSAASFHPIRSYRKQFEETLKSHGFWEGDASIEKILDIFSKVHLPEGKRILDSCPYELSGGMNQRVGIAMAVLMNPELFLADEPTSALDVTVQKQVVNELMELHKKMKNSMILVTHNMGVAARMCDRIAVMFQGKIVECKNTELLLSNSEHPYTQRLLRAVPKLKREY